jgi:hypothetical protein
MQAHVAGWMKNSPALVEGKWGEGDKVCVLEKDQQVAYIFLII